MRNFSRPNTTYIPVCIATKLTRRSHPGNEVAILSSVLHLASFPGLPVNCSASACMAQ